MFKRVTDTTTLAPGTEIKITERARYGKVIRVFDHKGETYVEYRDEYGGGVRMTQITNVRVQARRRKVKGAKFAK